MNMPAFTLWQKIAMGTVVVVGAGTVLTLRKAWARMTHKPARNFTVEEARAEMRRLADTGIVDIIDISAGPLGPSDHPRMTIGANVAGVQHVYYDGAEHPRKTIDNLDPRFGVYLVRLDQMLARMGVTELLDLGITHGSDNPTDVHNQGRAIDVAGVKGDGIDLNVYRDWGKKPEGAPGQYRLDISDPGYDMFREIYNFGTAEGADRSVTPDQGGPPTHIGEGSYLITPDHPNPKLHIDHQNHMHMQIGRTQGVEP